MSNEKSPGQHWDPLYRLQPDNWQYYIRGRLRTMWTTFTPEQQAQLRANAESLAACGLTDRD